MIPFAFPKVIRFTFQTSQNNWKVFKKDKWLTSISIRKGTCDDLTNMMFVDNEGYKPWTAKFGIRKEG